MYAKQQQFTADASHEMRTPLAVMKLAVQGLQEDEDSRLSDFAKESVNMLQSESERLSRLTENLMTLARSDEDILPVYTAQVDITALCKKVASQMSLLTAEKKLQLKQEIQDNLVMQGDEMALSRLLIILLDNAMKYSPEQTQITLRAAKVKTHLVLDVRDEGFGISDEDKQKIFDRFFRVEKARSRSHGGLGLGLSLALAIVRQHGGSIKVLDNKPRGTVMYVKLPTAAK
ncbi:MAG: HAMP domain-containing histidine kinase [Phascolarctobacterium succinatutens]|nr:HAMP domain-containing sensor histidine kinase [Phascolarctobacterium succinatutens]MCI6544529.1 HAMP domain-containing histidine kinase [Phascolarctobacterium succinatutens]